MIGFPDDDNGDVLGRMHAAGDRLDQPREIDFNFLFEERSGAIRFIELLDSPRLRVLLDFFEQESCWNVTVSRDMVPSHEGITRTEDSLLTRARACGGRADGWGCMQVD